ncbi:Auxin-responsive protein SAUR32 [Spatholobus suberectus]|nr:Auxin-responsive protein SAUR32 [Spatholobus suberectus]
MSTTVLDRTGWGEECEGLSLASASPTGKKRGVPKGCLAIKVGQGEEQQRFVVPVMYFNHPLFMQLLKEAEEEYGFDQKGTITIPCHVEEFRNVRGMIDREKSLHHHHHIGCFGF